MKSKNYYFLIGFLFCTSGLFAQLGIKAGVNMANEIKSFSQAEITNAFSSQNLTGYQIGLTYQFMPKKTGLGCELGVLVTQKGSAFNDSLTTAGFIQKGYNELNYLEVPFNLRYRISLGFLGIYGTAGIYGGYALSGKTVDEANNTTQIQSFQTFMDHLDYGYNLGAGLELFKKIQFGGTLTQGIRDTSVPNASLPVAKTTSNRVFTINLVYML
jgi:hypothetical protein